jgi:hypothetical protein
VSKYYPSYSVFCNETAGGVYDRFKDAAHNGTGGDGRVRLRQDECRADIVCGNSSLVSCLAE